MNHWLKFHKEVLREERREAALTTRTGKSTKTPTDTISRSDERARPPAGTWFPQR